MEQACGDIIAGCDKCLWRDGAPICLKCQEGLVLPFTMDSGFGVGGGDACVPPTSCGPYRSPFYGACVSWCGPDEVYDGSDCAASCTVPGSFLHPTTGRCTRDCPHDEAGYFLGYRDPISGRGTCLMVPPDSAHMRYPSADLWVPRCPLGQLGDPVSRNCVLRCPDGSWGDPTDPARLCYPCMANCARCSNSYSCDVWAEGYVADGSSGTQTCPSGMYPNYAIGQCASCDPACGASGCHGAGPGKCN